MRLLCSLGAPYKSSTSSSESKAAVEHASSGPQKKELIYELPERESDLNKPPDSGSTSLLNACDQGREQDREKGKFHSLTLHTLRLIAVTDADEIRKSL